MESSGSGRRGRRARRPLLCAVLAVVATGGVAAGGTACVTARALRCRDRIVGPVAGGLRLGRGG